MNDNNQGQWYFRNQTGVVNGPYTLAQMQEFALQGQIVPQQQVLSETFTGNQWCSAGQIQSLFNSVGHLPQTPPPPPPPPPTQVTRVLQVGTLEMEKKAEPLINTSEFRRTRYRRTGGPLCGLASAFIPGLGQLINGRVAVGLMFLFSWILIASVITFIYFFAIANQSSLIIYLALLILQLFLILASIVDAARVVYVRDNMGDFER